ncbi:hypothetical protein SAMN05192552_106611 [Natrinema hispanicum]|uniref:Uncharacterized protein n=2 Tax=Natrinema hispanicum TaxID=392421 RepID=A0A1G6YGV1_9EURY|nr:hypothetical protein SAMN05192552_106611 [Natrinema hispanicum]
MSMHTRVRTHSADNHWFLTDYAFEPVTDAGDATLAAFDPAAIPEADDVNPERETTNDPPMAGP